MPSKLILLLFLTIFLFGSAQGSDDQTIELEKLQNEEKQLESQIKQLSMNTESQSNSKIINLLKAENENIKNQIKKITLQQEIATLEKEINQSSNEDKVKKELEKKEKVDKLFQLEEEIKIYELGKQTNNIEETLQFNVEEENALYSQWNYLKELKKFQNQTNNYIKSHLEKTDLIDNIKKLEDEIDNFDNNLMECFKEIKELSNNQTEKEKEKSQSNYEEHVQSLIEIKSLLDKIIQKIEEQTGETFNSSSEELNQQEKEEKQEQQKEEENEKRKNIIENNENSPITLSQEQNESEIDNSKYESSKKEIQDEKEKEAKQMIEQIKVTQKQKEEELKKGSKIWWIIILGFIAWGGWQLFIRIQRILLSSSDTKQFEDLEKGQKLQSAESVF